MKFNTYTTNDVYSTKFFLYNYNNNLSRLVKIKSCRNKGFEIIKSKNKTIVETDKNEIERISLSRTKKNIRELALCNNFEYFVTFTVNSLNCDRYSLIDCQTKLKKLFKAYKRKYSNFSYLFITEKHKDGAFHFHGLCKGLCSSDLYLNKNGFLSSFTFDKLGFNSFSKIKDYISCCNYITKYISKDCVKNDKNQIYISSRGLKKAIKTEIFLPNDNDIKWNYENDYCCIKDIKK